MKNRIAVNSKFFKRSQVKGEMTHVMREFEHDKNVIDPSLTKHNFGTKSDAIERNYNNALREMPEGVKNSLIDSVLVFPVEQFEQVQKEHPEDWRRKINDSIVGMMKEMGQEMGFKPLGYKVHLDEGRKEADGTVVLNPHAHLLFANVCTQEITIQQTKKVTQKGADGKALRDPKNPRKYLYERNDDGEIKTETINIDLKGRAPLSLYQSRGKDSAWAKQQDIAAKHLKELGFERGIGKEITNARHLSKQQHVSRELFKAEQELESKKLLTASYESKLRELESAMILQQAKLDLFIEEREKYFSELLSEVPDASFEAILDAFDEIPEVMQEAALESTQERVFDLKDSFNFEQSRFTDLFLNSIKDKMEEKKVESEAPKSAPRKFGM
ncbi:TPA: hypothetical protein NKQ12_004674 [Vibrio parahaemolyticus]|nr:hypothetical protein [Vibrio parahaemolyticus]